MKKLKFANRIKELREGESLSQTKVAKSLNVDQSTFARWENGSFEPDLQTVIAIAEFFKVSADYLLGIED